MNIDYEKKYSKEIAEAVLNLRKKFESECTDENETYSHLSEYYETREETLEAMAQDREFIAEELREELVDLGIAILSKHVYFNYFFGYIPPALEGNKEIMDKVKEKAQKVKEFWASFGNEECNL